MNKEYFNGGIIIEDGLFIVKGENGLTIRTDHVNTEQANMVMEEAQYYYTKHKKYLGLISYNDWIIKVEVAGALNWVLISIYPAKYISQKPLYEIKVNR